MELDPGTIANLILLFMFLLVMVMILFTYVRYRSKLSRQKQMYPRRRTVSSDGHAVSRRDDITCTDEAGHNHQKEISRMEQEFGPRYIVHNDPEEGYVVLNGVKRRLEDCKNL
jgi:hypothetical protein